MILCTADDRSNVKAQYCTILCWQWQSTVTDSNRHTRCMHAGRADGNTAEGMMLNA